MSGTQAGSDQGSLSPTRALPVQRRRTHAGPGYEKAPWVPQGTQPGRRPPRLTRPRGGPGEPRASPWAPGRAATSRRVCPGAPQAGGGGAGGLAPRPRRAPRPGPLPSPRRAPPRRAAPRSPSPASPAPALTVGLGTCSLQAAGSPRRLELLSL